MKKLGFNAVRQREFCSMAFCAAGESVFFLRGIKWNQLLEKLIRTRSRKPRLATAALFFARDQRQTGTGEMPNAEIRMSNEAEFDG